MPWKTYPWFMKKRKPCYYGYVSRVRGNFMFINSSKNKLIKEKVMGAIGSSRWLEHTKRKTVEESLSVDISWLKNGVFRPGHITQIKWTKGMSTYSINVRMAGALALFSYQARMAHGEFAVRNVKVRLNKMGCHLGGYRGWFACPKCSRRCRILYFDTGKPICRVCANLTYNSCQMNYNSITRGLKMATFQS